MKKKVLIVLAIVFSVILVFYAVELISTNSLMNYVKDLADGKIPVSETEGKSILTTLKTAIMPNSVLQECLLFTIFLTGTCGLNGTFGYMTRTTT